MTSYIVQQILNGIQLGSIYALIALGYTMVYGIIKLINFAHADIFMVGAYVAFFLVAFFTGMAPTMPFFLWIWIALLCGYLLYGIFFGRIPFLKALCTHLDKQKATQTTWYVRTGVVLLKAVLELTFIAGIAALLAPLLYYISKAIFSVPLGPFLLLPVLLYSMAICAVMGVALEKIVYRPLRFRPRLSVLITALAASLFIENFSSLDVVFGNSYRAFPQIVPQTNVVTLKALDISISSLFFINSGVVVTMLIGLWFLVEKTLIGKQMRAVSYNKNASALMGINVDKVISITFMVGASLAGVSGVLYSMNYGVLQSPYLGFFPGIKAFIAAVLGGIGSLPGAVLGAYLMGISEVFANSIDSNLGFAAAFLVLIIVLLVKPMGLLGKSENEKV